MKTKLKLLLFCGFCYITANAQIPIAARMTMPSTMPANISEWATAVPPVSIQAMIKPDSFHNIPPDVEYAKILVTIRGEAGGKVCGSYTQKTAPDASITSLVKMYRGGEIEKLLGQSCTLKPGSYSLCVQFFADYNGQQKTLSEEATKPFTVKGNEAISYAPPQNLQPADGKIFTEIEAKQPLNFRWTPIVPRPQEEITYRLKVWQVKEGQAATQVIKAEQPVLQEDIKNQTQLVAKWDALLRDRLICMIAWQVEALNIDGKIIGVSSPTSFNTCNSSSCKITMKLDSIKCTDRKDKRGNAVYDVKVTLNNQSADIYQLNNAMNIGNNPDVIACNNSPKFAINTNVASFENIPSFPSIITGGITTFHTAVSAIASTSSIFLQLSLFNRAFKNSCNPSDSIKLPDCGNTDSECLNALIRNGDFTQNTISGTMPSGGSAFWSKGYGTPKIDNTVGEGCFDQGMVQLSGNVNQGDAITQTLDLNNRIIAGKKYKISIAARFLSTQNTLDYAKIRVVAFNNSLPTSGIHPAPSTDIAIIGRSGKVHDCGDWAVFELPVWTANKNFKSIAINAFTNDNTSAKVYIDNISTCEVQNDDCGDIKLDDKGNPVMPSSPTLPSGYSMPTAAQICQPDAEEEEYFNGTLVDLYGYNGTQSMYQNLNNNNCANIGGTLPQEVVNYNCDNSLRVHGIGGNCDSLDKVLNTPIADAQPDTIVLRQIPPLPTDNTKKCVELSKDFKKSMAFNGRDIIYVHGLQFSHIKDRILLDSRALADWPNTAQFYEGGYYKDVAKKNWEHHINHFLKDKGYKNRYLIVTYNCSQSADVAINSVMAQIREAMANGRDVQADADDPRGTSCFGKDFVFISHSTGGLVTDLVLSKANKTKTQILERLKYGNVGYISDRCKAHIAMHGAMGGSNLAKIVVGTNQPIIFRSILFDLTPEITYSKWAADLNSVPVPVLTVAGGHPAADLDLLFAGPIGAASIPQIIPGIDDGVVNMESSSGRNTPALVPVSQFYTLLPSRAFDMGIKKDRAVGFYLDQMRGINRFSIASSQYLTQTGMVEPNHSIQILYPQFNNHYTFLQSASEHLQPNKYAYFNNGNYAYSILESVNDEEELVTDNSNLYSTGLINPAIIDQMGETIKGKTISYPTLKIVKKKGIPRLMVIWKQFYLWKRTYHKLIGNDYDMDFAYKYLFPN